MSSWQLYVDNLLKNNDVEDAAILCNQTGNVWAAAQNGFLKNVQPSDTKDIRGKDHACLFSNGVTLGGEKCTVLRDGLESEEATMDLRTKTNITYSETRNVCISKTRQTLIIAVAKKDVHGGRVNTAVFNIGKYLKDNNY